MPKRKKKDLKKSLIFIAFILCIIVGFCFKRLTADRQYVTQDLQGTNIIEYDIMLYYFFARDMENKNEKIEEAKTRALDLYVKDQFVCSEAVLSLYTKFWGPRCRLRL